MLRSDPQPLQVSSVVDQAYAAIRERIAGGALRRGARIHQEYLAEELGVSRTPVREALRRLAAEGLVEMHTNRGARVADVGGEDMRAAYEARLVIEPGAARLAAQAGAGAGAGHGAAPRPAAQRAAALELMRDALVAQRRAIPNVSRSFEANRRFHLALVQAAGNPFLSQFVQRLWVARIGEVIYERQRESGERMGLDADEHEDIVAAINAGDGRRAETLTRRHLVDAMQRSAALLE